MLLRSILASVVSLFSVGLILGRSQIPANPGAPSFLYTVAKDYDALAWMHGADRFPSGAALYWSDGKTHRLLAAGFAASADPAVSFDGQYLLFAGKQRAGDPWQIWTIPFAGGEPRRVISAHGDCVRPLYLPDDRVVYACNVAGRFVIRIADLAGGNPLSLTYGPANALPTDVLRDGRILFEAAYPFGTAGDPEIYTVYSDGTGVESYRCDHGGTRHEGKQLGSRDIVFVRKAGLARFTSAKAQEVPISAPAGEYAGDVFEMGNGDWLVPWRPHAHAPFQLVTWTPGTPALRPLLAEQDANVLQPVVLAQRVVPNRHPSGLHDWPNANLLCLNAYTSKHQIAAGTIYSVRVYELDDAGNPKLLGTAPVERDGSFFVQVPTEQALQIELLDQAGKTLQRESGYFWMRQGEQRACVGCHAGPETAPENAVPMVLLKTTTPADLTATAAENTPGVH